MAWHLPGAKPLSEPMMVNWVNGAVWGDTCQMYEGKDK